MRKKPEAGDAPAARARRFRRLKFLLLIPYFFVFIVLVLILDSFGWFSDKTVQILVAAVSLILILLYGLWKSAVPCPRCGWNIYLKKTRFPFIMTPVPSSCPNCGLDLEKAYVQEKQSARYDK